MCYHSLALPDPPTYGGISEMNTNTAYVQIQYNQTNRPPPTTTTTTTTTTSTRGISEVLET